MDDEMIRWQAEWTRTGEVPRDVVQRARRARTSATLGLAGGWVVAAVLAGTCVWFAIQVPLAVIRTVLAFSGTLTLLIMAVHTWHHAAVGRADEEAPRAHLEELRRRLERDLALARTWWPFAVLVGGLSIWVPWKLSVDWETIYGDRPGLVVAVVGGLAALTLAGGLAQWLTGLRSRRKLEALESLIAELEEPGERE